MGYTGIIEKRKLLFRGLGFRGGLWLQVCMFVFDAEAHCQDLFDNMQIRYEAK